ncbi:MAG TPA: amidase family protein, partial [Solirubrobacterales bacterium]
VERAARAFAGLGASVTEVSVPAHGQAPQLWNLLAVAEGAELFAGGRGGCLASYYRDDLLAAYDEARRLGAAELPDVVKAMLLIGLSMRDALGDRPRAAVLAQRPVLRQAYDRALGEVDLLLLPTTPQRATEIPDAEAPLPLRFLRSVEMVANTCPFNLTGHPALSLPCGLAGGLPIGMMLVGRHGEDAAVLGAGHHYQAEVLSPPSP